MLAGAMLGLSFMTRPTTLLLGLFFAIEVLRASRTLSAPLVPKGATALRRVRTWLAGVRVGFVLTRVAWFSLSILAIGCVAMWMNYSRFDNPFEFGREYLQIRWRARIERWGLFNYHYFAKNLSVFVAGMPWLSIAPPFVKLSRHGLALWLTTPALLLVLWPKRVTPTMIGLYVAAVAVALLNLCYQNSGWIQFGYRFALDYMVVLFVLLAMGRRRFGPLFYAGLVFALAVNTFGAITFSRAGQFYDGDASQDIVFQPD
jgi:hypothetical protein